MAKLQFWPFYGDAWRGGTIGMTLEEKGFYVDVLVLLYSESTGALIDDDERLSRLTGINIHRWRRLKARLIEIGKLQLADGRLRNGKTTRVLAKLKKKYPGLTQIEPTESSQKVGEKLEESLKKVEGKLKLYPPDLAKINGLEAGNLNLNLNLKKTSPLPPSPTVPSAPLASPSNAASRRAPTAEQGNLERTAALATAQADHSKPRDSQLSEAERREIVRRELAGALKPMPPDPQPRQKLNGHAAMPSRSGIDISLLMECYEQDRLKA